MITDRQLRLLNAVISEYINTAEPVGSVEVVKKYNFKYSPATARNEMARLLKLGFLEMAHTSSGRIPTAMAYRLFLDQIMQEEELPVLQEVAMKQRLWPSRFEFDKLLRQAIVSLSENVGELALATANDGYITCAGMVNILDHKEFWDIDVARTALGVLDRHELLEEIFKKAPHGGEVRSVIGAEIGIENMENCSFTFAQYQAGSKSGHIGVFGPSRLKYEKVIPAVRYTKNLVEELGESW
jgi:transcriptional regulator of heat shock response